jgi:HEAT repeat protein
MRSLILQRLFVTFLALGAMGLPAQGYIDVSPTLGRLINQSSHIVVLRVEKVNLEKRAILFQKVADLKGQSPNEPIKHQITAGLHPREPATILEWLEPGQIAISFQNGKTAEVCIGDYWYECYAGPDGWWIMNCGQAQLCFAFKGPVTKLKGHVETILAGKEAVVTAVKYGADDAYWRACKKVIAMRDVPQGNRFPICRFKASLTMPGFIYELYRDPKFVAETGAAGVNDVPALMSGLQEPDWPARLEAAQTLGLIGPAAKEAVPALRKALQDSKPAVRIRVAEALTAIDPSQREAITVLVELLKSPEDRIRKGAADALGNAGIDAETAVPSLTAALGDPDAKVRWAAADALGRFGPEASAASTALMKALQDSESTVRSAAIDALGSIGPRAKAALPVLNPLLQDGDKLVRAAAAAALFRIDRRKAQATIPIFIQELRETDTRSRWHALTHLRKMMPEAKEAVPVPLLIDALDDLDFGVRGMAATVLGDIGPKAQAAVPALSKALQSNDVWVRGSAALALVSIMGTKATMAVPVLVDGLLDEDQDVRADSLRALQLMGPFAREALPTLRWLAKKDDALRGLAAETIWRITLDPETPVKLLVQELQETNTPRQNQAVRILGQMGPQAKAAVPALRILIHDEDHELRAASLDSLQRIDPAAWAQLMQRSRQDSIAWPWRLAAWAIAAMLLSLPIGYWSLINRGARQRDVQ